MLFKKKNCYILEYTKVSYKHFNFNLFLFRMQLRKTEEYVFQMIINWRIFHIQYVFIITNCNCNKNKTVNIKKVSKSKICYKQKLINNKNFKLE